MPLDYDVVVIGAGPVGLAVALECQSRGLDCVLVDKGCLSDSLYRYPRHMTFFSTAERIEIAGHPFPCPDHKPSREQALHYYRLLALRSGIPLRLYERVLAIAGAVDGFHVHTQRGSITARRVVLAIGFFDHPVMLDVDGEDLDKVSHYFTDGHRYAGQDLLIVGGANSAVIAALECWRLGARVTMVHRGADFYSGVKYWLLPDIRNRIAEGSITAHLQTSLRAIARDHVLLRSEDREYQIPNDFVLALTGYRSDYEFLRALGIELDPENQHPLHDPHSFESRSRAGIHLAGTVLCGDDTGSIFIENGREHAVHIADHLAEQLRHRRP